MATRYEKGFLVVGTVFRGNSELDGVLLSEGRQHLGEIVSDMLIGSKHYGQTRLILLDENMLPEPINYDALWEKTRKPVLVINRDGEFNPRYMFKYHEETVSASGINEESARRVLRFVYSKSGSESLRIASIILRSISKLHNV